MAHPSDHDDLASQIEEAEQALEELRAGIGRARRSVEQTREALLRLAAEPKPPDHPG